MSKYSDKCPHCTLWIAPNLYNLIIVTINLRIIDNPEELKPRTNIEVNDPQYPQYIN